MFGVSLGRGWWLERGDRKGNGNEDLIGGIPLGRSLAVLGLVREGLLASFFGWLSCGVWSFDAHAR